MNPRRTPQPHQKLDTVAMRIAVTGSTGLVGSALVPYLRSRGHTVSRVLRTAPEPGSVLPRLPEAPTSPQVPQ